MSEIIAINVLQKKLDEAERVIAEMHDDLLYLNKMCITLMSLLPEETTPDDIRKAMEEMGSKVRE